MAGTIRNRIEELRNLRGWSQETLAKKIGVSKMSMSRYENGDTLTLDRLQQIAEAFEVSLADVLNMASIANLQNEVEPANMEGSIAAAMAAKNLKVYRILESAVPRAGVQKGDIIAVDQSAEAIAAAGTGQLMLAEVEMKGASPTLIVRQYVHPDMLITNRVGSNIVISLGEAGLSARLLGVVIAA